MREISFLSGFAIAATVYGALHWAFPDARVVAWVGGAAREEGVFEGVEEPAKCETEAGV